MTSASRRRIEPLPGDPLGKRFCQTFSYLWKPIVKANNLKDPWETLTRHPLRPRELWTLWQDAERLVGVRFGGKTTYGIIDLDASGIYHPTHDPQAVATIRAALETIGITRTFLIRSSWSGGLHLWLPLPESVPTFWFAAALKQCLEAQGLILWQGSLEIFPNCKSYARSGEFTEYHAHRLPLQTATGSQILDFDFHPIVGGLEQFFALWDSCASGQDMHQLSEAIAQVRSTFKRYSVRRPSEAVEAWRKALEIEIAEGWTDFGQTNHLLKSIACYGVVFAALQGSELIDYVIRIAISRLGYQDWCRHQHEISKRCRVWAQAAERYYWVLGTAAQRQGNINREDQVNQPESINWQRSQDAQNRIRSVVRQLETETKLPMGISAREAMIVQLARCSKTTLRKYLSLWHPEHYKTDVKKVCTPVGANNINALVSELDIHSGSLEIRQAAEVHAVAYMKGREPLTEVISLNLKENSLMQKLRKLKKENLVSEQNSCVRNVTKDTQFNRLNAHIGESLMSNLVAEQRVRRSPRSDQAQKLKVGAATPSAPTANIALNRRVDDYKASPVSIGKTQVDMHEVCYADSIIVASTPSVSLPVQRHWGTVDRAISEQHDRKMQRWLDSGDPILMKEAQHWFSGQSQPTHKLDSDGFCSSNST